MSNPYATDEYWTDRSITTDMTREEVARRQHELSLRLQEGTTLKEVENSKGLEDPRQEQQLDLESYIYSIKHAIDFELKSVRPTVLAELETMYSIPSDAEWTINRSNTKQNCWLVSVSWREIFNKSDYMPDIWKD